MFKCKTKKKRKEKKNRYIVGNCESECKHSKLS